MLGTFAVEVKVRCLQGSRWLWAGEGAGLAVPLEHRLAEPLLAESRLAQADTVAALDPFLLTHVGAPPRLASHQVLIQDGAQAVHVQAPDGVLLGSRDVSGIECLHRE